jgi:membrane protein required for beta-lactamase induction
MLEEKEFAWSVTKQRNAEWLSYLRVSFEEKELRNMKFLVLLCCIVFLCLVFPIIILPIVVAGITVGPLLLAISLFSAIFSSHRKAGESYETQRQIEAILNNHTYRKHGFIRGIWDRMAED